MRLYTAYITATLVAILLIIFPLFARAESVTVGAHLGTYHIRPGYNNINPGVYVRWGYFTAGTYHNSINKQSTYVGLTYEWETPSWPLISAVALTAGGVSGYPARSVIPFVMPSLRFDVYKDVSLRTALVPEPLFVNRKLTGIRAAGVHFSIERRF